MKTEKLLDLNLQPAMQITEEFIFHCTRNRGCHHCIGIFCRKDSDVDIPPYTECSTEIYAGGNLLKMEK